MWDDAKNKPIASITFKEDIENFGLTEKVIYVKCLEGIMVFELRTLKYITTFDKTSSFIIFSCTDSIENDIACSYIAYAQMHLKMMKVRKIFLHPKTSGVTLIKTSEISTGFNDIKTIKFVNRYLIISNYYGNKVHLYSIRDWSLKYCFFLGYYSYVLSNISIDKTEKYFMLSTNNKYIKMFKLKNSTDTKCKCNLHKDEDIDVDRKRKLYFYWNKIFGVISEMHCRFRYNSEVLTLASFDYIQKDRITLIDSNGKLFVLLFNRKIRSEINAIQIKTWI